ncbi:Tox-REase-5 domain-containing protein [Mycobacteroides abscessus]|uniref:Tox-REase-5 domain-containing protein n=1 Tax=Mycobacteroides abscessus TaxID=36809 RepID=UPI000926F62D|nr:hypothetical protein DDT48_13900 [Mycobacteroides abscessus]MBN7551486.1 hypothetical protein [Mycobacteroides abscessus subsp. abscessus]PVB37663.1 hypothetical protein DDJ39_18290 [Mycobacteroides abscessus]QSM68094.1 hypothetical protein IN837_15615 [Mycobacteroides abscessus subsp. abscessus]RIT05505.1 hypothetical protein D2E74_13910 [Mycobacteroides abscessus]
MPVKAPEVAVPPVPKPIGQWGPSNERFGGFSKTYQEFVTGRPISEAYWVNGKKFDDFKNGALIDAKGDYAQFLEPNGQWKHWFPGDKEFLKLATEQIAKPQRAHRYTGCLRSKKSPRKWRIYLSRTA